jgi:hypothetical protein
MNGRITHHGPVGNQPNKREWRQKTETDDDGIPQSLEVRLIQARIHDEQEDRRNLGWSAQCVFDSRVLWQKFCRQVGVGDVLVMRRERIPLKAERTDPQFSSNVDLAACTPFR